MNIITQTTNVSNHGNRCKLQFFIFLMILLLSNLAMGQRPTATLIAHYPFDGNAKDITKNNLHGTENGVAPTFDRFGNPDRAFTFDGENDFIQLPVDINPKILPKITITMWARTRTVDGRPKVFSHDDGGFDRTIGIDDRDGGAGWSAFSGTGKVLGHHPVTSGKWTFLAVVYDQLYEERGQIVGRVKLYVNDDSLYQEPGQSGNGFKYIHVGVNPGTDQYFSGSIDDVRIYDDELTQVQINQLYMASNPHAGESPALAWDRKYSGSGGRDFEIVNSDGGYIIGSTSYEGPENGGNDMKLIRTDSLGNISWVNSFGTDESETFSALATNDIGYMLTGMREKEYRSGALQLTYVNIKGEEIWSKSYGDSAADTFYRGVDVISSGSGKFTIVGHRSVMVNESIWLIDSDIWLMQINDFGTVLSEKMLGGNYEDGPVKLIKTADGGMLLAAVKGKAQYESAVWLMRMDNKGETIWDNTYDDGYSRAVCQTSDGGFLILYIYNSINTILKVDSFGEVLWQKEYWGDFRDVTETTDGGFILVGSQNSYDWYGYGQKDIRLVRADNTGEIKWIKVIGEETSEEALRIRQTPEGGFVISGSQDDKIYLAKLDPEKKVTGVSDKFGQQPEAFSLLQNYPNPFNPETNIMFTITDPVKVKVDIFNILGQHITTLVDESRLAGTHSIRFNGTGLPSGIYFYTFHAGNFKAVKKMMLVK